MFFLFNYRQRMENILWICTSFFDKSTPGRLHVRDTIINLKRVDKLPKTKLIKRNLNKIHKPKDYQYSLHLNLHRIRRWTWVISFGDTTKKKKLTVPILVSTIASTVWIRKTWENFLLSLNYYTDITVWSMDLKGTISIPLIVTANISKLSRKFCPLVSLIRCFVKKRNIWIDLFLIKIQSL